MKIWEKTSGVSCILNLIEIDTRNTLSVTSCLKPESSFIFNSPANKRQNIYGLGYSLP